MAEANPQSASYPWEKSYPEEVDWRATIPVMPMHKLLERSVAEFGPRPVMEFMDRVWTYSELGELVDRAAKGLQNTGVVKGTKVAILLPNCPAYVIFYYAILKAGGTVVNCNPLYAIDELVNQIEDADADYLITLDLKVVYDKAGKALGRSRLKKLIICPMAGQLPFPKSLLFGIVKRAEIADIPKDASHVWFKALMKNDGRPAVPEIDPATDIAVLQYTGGTTGIPKAAMLTHANLTANVTQSTMMFYQADRGNEVMVGVLPFFHVFAMTVVLNFSINTGTKMILLPRFELDTVLKTIHEKRPTFFPAVPTIYIAINSHPDVIAGKIDLSSIKICLSGGAALPKEVQETFERLSGCALVEGYGLSETAPVASCNPTNGTSRPGSLGLPVPGTVISIASVDEPTKFLPQGEKGEICIAGPQVMKGYWKRSDESETVFAGGPFHTGDIGYIDEDGFVFLIDRLKEVIIAGGYNVYPRYVEEAIYKHPAVVEVTVIGVDDEYRQQTVKAFVKLKEGEILDEDGLKAFLKDKLSPIEMPKQIEFRAELPKTVIGKLSKKELVAEEAARSGASS